MTYMANHGDRIKYIKHDGVSYEVHVENEETASKGNFEVFVGLEVEKLVDVPVEVVIKILPPAEYAVFTLEGKQIVSDWPKMICQWMAGSGYQAAYKYHFQLYDQRFKGLENLDESVLDVHIPVLRVGDVSDNTDV